VSAPGNGRVCVYRFDPDSRLEGALAGALERIDRSTNGHVHDALLVACERGSGETVAIDLTTAYADGSVAAMLDFRLDPRRRRTLTARTLSSRRPGFPRGAVEAVGATLEPGTAVLAVLFEGDVAPVLDEAVARSGGRRVADDPVDISHAPRLHERLLAVVSAVHAGPGAI
jgi:hypothetical protein